MKIIIDIPEVYYEALSKTEEIISSQRSGKTLMNVIYSAVANGIPLPENHGRLIDADYLKDVILLHNFHGNNKNIVPYTDRRGYRLRQREVDESIINAPTIIEADKEKKDADSD